MIRPRIAKSSGTTNAGVGTGTGAGNKKTIQSPMMSSLSSSSSAKRRKNGKQQNRFSQRGCTILLLILGAMLIGIGMIFILWHVQKSAGGNNSSNNNSLLRSSNNNNKQTLNSKLLALASSSKTTTSTSSSSSVVLTNAKKMIQSVREEFQTRYGQDYAPQLFERGIQTFGSIDATAMRILSAAYDQRPFVFAFSGYSVTVGRGNYFNQSFPFVMQQILQGPFQDIFGMDVIVRNGAIGGIPSFPYGFCLEHFLGIDPDVISWDYSMNEGPKDSSVLESFVRQSLQQLPKHPMMILLDRNNEPRTTLLEKYTTITSTMTTPFLQDAIAVGKKEIVDSTVFEITKDHPEIAPGFQDWDVFGAPAKCPGRGSWHPKKQEHAMIGWLIAMHFINALERAIELLSSSPQTTTTTTTTKATVDSNTGANDKRPILEKLQDMRQLGDLPSPPFHFPKPYSTSLPKNSPEVSELLFGHKVEKKGNGDGNDNDDDEYYIMKDISCRTSFLPATDHSKVLPSVIVSGLSNDSKELDIMIDRTDEHYQQGWVLDVSKVERDTKKKVENCGGLGYIDMKVALYGIPESGTIRLWLPFEKTKMMQQQQGKTAERSLLLSHHDDHSHDDISNAKHWFDDIVLCEANEKRENQACQLDRDLDIVVGGVTVSSSTTDKTSDTTSASASGIITPIKGAGEYLKRATCVNVGIPETAQITRLGQVQKIDPSSSSTSLLLSNKEKQEKFPDFSDDAVGLVVDIKAKTGITRQHGACCLSHIVWEQH